MTEVQYGLKSIADQRYYHFAIVRLTQEFSLATYWKRVGDIVQANGLDDSDEKFAVHRRKYRSSKGYARGGVADVLSEKGEGNSPFFYDLFASKVEMFGDTYLMCGFPFIRLAQEVMNRLVEKGNILKVGGFIGADVPKLVSTLEGEAPRRFEGLTTEIVNVAFVVTEDKSLTAVRLGGASPLSADVYLKFLKGRVAAGFCLPNQCALACKRDWLPEPGGTEPAGVVRSRVHVDSYGNFRFYAQAACANVSLLPFAVGQLRAWGCLRRVLGVPFARVRQEELE